MEPKRDMYKNLNASLSSVVFQSLNNVKIRHNNKSQVEIPEPQKIEFLDDLFILMLHLIRTEYVVLKQKEIKNVITNSL